LGRNKEDDVVFTALSLTEKLAPAQTALLIVDMQNDYCAPGGLCDRQDLPLGTVRAIVPALQELLHAARQASTLVVYAQMTTHPGVDVQGPWLELRHRSSLVDICLEGSWGQQVIDELEPAPADVLVKKSRYSAFVGTKLDQILRDRGIRTCAVTGVASNGCVDCTLRDAFQLDYYVVGVRNAVAGFDQELHTATLRNWSRRYGDVLTAGEIKEIWNQPR